MKGTDREDAMARALDLLPTDDPARCDPRLARDKGLVEEARATREAAADLWLAVSPLRAAPPDLMHSVMEKIGLPVTVANRRQRFIPWIAASGWAAAAVVAVSLWPQRQAQDLPAAAVVGRDAGKGPAASGDSMVTVAPPVQEAPARERQQRDEAMRLRNTIADLREEQLVSAPRVMSLSAPGSIQRSPEESRDEVVGLFTRALRHSLVAGRGHAAGPQPLSFEGSGLPDRSAFGDEETVLVHRGFPEDSWQEFGLRRSDEGNYYDPAQQVLWVPDSAGLDFYGKRTPAAEIDLEAFKASPEVQDVAATVRPGEPQGYVVEDRLKKKAEVIIGEVPAPSAGNKQVLKWTDASGNSGELEVGTVAATAKSSSVDLVAQANSVVVLPYGVTPFSSPGAMQLQPNSFNGSGGTYMISASISCDSSLASFELIEVPILKNGKPKRVLVSGGRRRAR